MLRQFASMLAVTGGRERGNSWEKRALVIVLVVAAIVRFWGVGAYGLHKPDEDTTALPAVHILQDGLPRFPSGMMYTRALAQSYLIAGSVMAFGQTEWALRLPSVLCGLLVVALAYVVGRRFLQPAWNVAFMAVAALLPALIADSQEVRMYIFLLASLVGFAALVFRWERSGHWAHLLCAVAVMLLGIQLQQLAIFGSLLIFFPALAHGDRRKFLQAAGAYVPIALYFVYVRWTPSPYPEAAADFAPSAPVVGAPPADLGLRFQPLLTAVAILGGGLIAWLNVRVMTHAGLKLVAASLLLLGFLSLASLSYFLALLLLAAGVILAHRHGGASPGAVAVLIAGTVAVAMVHVVMLQHAGVGSLRKIAGVMNGQPSSWPFLIATRYSPVASVVTFAGLGWAAWRVAARKPVEDYWLFFFLAAAIPLFGLGLTAWYVPPRYTEFAMLPTILVALAVAQQVMAGRTSRAPPAAARLRTGMAAALCVTAIVNPIQLARAVNPGATFPDHRSAAQYMRSVQLGPRDVVLAEELLLQTYYLGRVDYWLIDRNVAAFFVQRWNGKFVDQYTHTEVMGSAQELQALLDRPDRGAVYVIGSGESQEDGRLFMRGQGLFDLLQTEQFKVVYVAPDGLTKVWKVDAPAAR